MKWTWMRHPVAVGPFIETEAQMQERLPFKEVTDWFWKRAKNESKRREGKRET